MPTRNDLDAVQVLHDPHLPANPKNRRALARLHWLWWSREAGNSQSTYAPSFILAEIAYWSGIAR